MTSRRVDDAARAIARLQRRVDQLERRASRVGHGHFLGESLRSSNFATTSTSFADLGTVAVTVNVVAGRKLKISAVWPSSFYSSAGLRGTVEIADGANTRLQARVIRHGGTTAEQGGSFFVTDAPGAGSKTYKLRAAATDGGTFTISAATTNPILLVVEDIGAV